MGHADLGLAILLFGKYIIPVNPFHNRIVDGL